MTDKPVRITSNVRSVIREKNDDKIQYYIAVQAFGPLPDQTAVLRARARALVAKGIMSSMRAALNHLINGDPTRFTTFKGEIETIDTVSVPELFGVQFNITDRANITTKGIKIEVPALKD